MEKPDMVGKRLQKNSVLIEYLDGTKKITSLSIKQALDEFDKAGQDKSLHEDFQKGIGAVIDMSTGEEY